MSSLNQDPSLFNISIDNEGYPYPLDNTPELYFQSDGLWYRETGGDNASVYYLKGNNPHIGPYDGGDKYLSQFKCVIPNFTSTTIVDEVFTTETNNLFYNYNNGTINNNNNTLLSGCPITYIEQTIAFSDIEEQINNDYVPCETNESGFFWEVESDNGNVITPKYGLDLGNDFYETSVLSLKDALEELGFDVDIEYTTIDGNKIINLYPSIIGTSCNEISNLKVLLNGEVIYGCSSEDKETVTIVKNYTSVICDGPLDVIIGDDNKPSVTIVDGNNNVTNDIIINSTFKKDPLPESNINDCGCEEEVICDNMIQIDIDCGTQNETPTPCGYKSFQLGGEGYVIYEMEDESLQEFITVECCETLGFTVITVEEEVNGTPTQQNKCQWNNTSSFGFNGEEDTNNNNNIGNNNQGFLSL